MDFKSDLQSDDDFDCSNGYSDHFTSNNGGGNSGSNGSSGQLRLQNSGGGMSKAELRKTNKPIMEKRRRARINHCLNELKSLILEAMKKDPARHTKLEKADILEMTVKHLQSIQRQQLNMAIQTDPGIIHKFKTGFVECAEEVNRYVSQLDGIEPGVRQRLTHHLSNCANGLDQIGSMTNFHNGYRGQVGGSSAATGGGGVGGLFGTLGNPVATASAAANLFPALPQDLNNNSSGQGGLSATSAAATAAPIHMGGVQLIPSRLPSGEFALIMPNANAASAANLLSSVNGGNGSGSNNTPTAAASTFAAWSSGLLCNGLSKAAATNGGSAPPHHLPAMPPLPADFSQNFQRLSAFSKPLNATGGPAPTPAHLTPQHLATFPPPAGITTTTTTSATIATSQHKNTIEPSQTPPATTTATTTPPLSPISSVSSHADDSSLLHTSSDFASSSRPATPPQDITNDSGISQHNFSGVFSTPPSSADTSLSTSVTHLQQQQVSSTSGTEVTSLKRKHAATETATATAVDSSDSSDEPSTKKFASSAMGDEVPITAIGGGKGYVKREDGERGLVEERDNMWRPW